MTKQPIQGPFQRGRSINLFDPNFPQQSNFVKDKAKMKALWCTRRAAKSFTAGLYMVYEALLTPRCNILFVGKTRESAKDIVWKDILQVLNQKHRLNARFNRAELTMTFPNGSLIKVTGIDSDEDLMLNQLGKKFRLVCIDEASVYTINLRHFVYDILKPAMADLEGTICLFGTASNFTRGLFYDITTGKEAGWSLHTWTAHDNPHVVAQWQRQLDEIKANRPLYMDTPQYRQWFLNEWVVEEDKLVYRFKTERNMYTKLPLHKFGWTYTLGIDLGYEDDTAFVLCGYHEHDPHLYVINTYKQPHMTLDMVVEKVREYMADKDMAPCRVIIDGSAKQAVESMRMRSAIPFEYADKVGKVEYIGLLNADLVQGIIKVGPTCGNLVDEMMSLVWKTEGDKVSLPRKEHPSLPNHLCDAFLYNWRMCWHFQHSTPDVRPPVGSVAWYDQTQDGIWEREREHLQQVEAASQGNWPDEQGGFGHY